jgi:hypothetical protein
MPPKLPLTMTNTPELSMMAKSVAFATLIFVGLAIPASARNYYVVQNLKTLKCYVLPKKPKTKSVVVVDGSKASKTRNEAEAARGSFLLCKP